MVQLLSRWCLWAWVALVMLMTVGGGVAGVAAVKDPQNQSGHLVDLHEDNWELMLNGEWMVEFFAPWCPACKNLAPTWEHFASAALDSNVNVAKIDVTTSPSLSGRFFVTALPTIYHVINGEFRQYRGARDGDALMFFLKHKQWERIEPISAWKKPDTIHMSVLSYFFKLSHTLKDFNVRLQEDYGLPTWGSYALFATGTIFVGAALGLLLVCVVDFLYPPKKSQRQSFSQTKGRALNAAVEDIVSDEIEDDAPTRENDDDYENDEDDDNAYEEGEEDEEGDNNEQDDDEEEDDEDAGEEASTSEGEKQSHSESEEVVTPEPTKATPSAAPKAKTSIGAVQTNSKSKSTQPEKSASPAEVRKRKPRKAD